MDCRHSLLGLFMVGMLVGCNGRGGGSGGAITPGAIGKAPTTPTAPSGPSGKPEQAIARRNPTPETVVSFGNLRLQQASDPDRPAPEKQHCYEEARKAFQEAIRIDPKHLPAHKGLAQVYLGVNDQERAVAAYRKALELAPKDALLWFDLGMCYSRKQQWQPALEAMNKGLQLDPENRQLAHLYGYALARAGLTEQALGMFVHLDGEAQAHYNLARMQAHLKQPEEARKHLAVTLKKSPDHKPARELLTKLETPSKPIQTVGFESPEESELPRK